jgi:hypothetical protein
MPTQLLRLCAILQSLHEAFRYVSNFASEKKCVDQQFVEKIEENLLKCTEYKVCVQNVDRAYTLLEFFTKNKLVLSGYCHNDWSQDCKTIILDFIKNTPAVLTVEQQIINYILLSTDQIINAHNVTKKFGVPAPTTKAILEKLVNLNIGITTKSKNNRGKASVIFEKRDPNVARKDLAFLRNLQSLHVDIEDYFEVNKRMY